jgi:DNA-binding transcriptional MerR regulator
VTGAGSSSPDRTTLRPGDRLTPALTVSAVARRLGVAPATLRTWDRRYGLGPSEHTAGTHRRYTPEDVARLGVMRRLTLEGVAPAEAARVALQAPLEQAQAPASVTVLPVPAEVLPAVRPARSDLTPGGTDAARGGTDAARGGTDALPSRTDAATGGPAATGHRARGAGGRVIALPHGSAAARGLARAAMALDGGECSRLLRESITRRGVVATWQEVAVPVLVGIGERWQTTGEGVEVEHLLSECLLAALRGVTLGPAPAVNSRQVLLACAAEEQHSLPLHVLAAALAERHVASRMLGARVPADALADAVRRSGPLAVLVWSQRPATGDPRLVTSLPQVRPAPFLLVGGPGWDAAALPAGVTRVTELAEAVARLAAAAGG